MFSAEEIKDIVTEAGFDVCGIIPARPFADQRAFYDGWLRRGYGGGLGYLGRNVDKRFDPTLLVPGARSIVVCGVSYKNDTSMGYGESLSPRIASYARAADYHTTIKAMLRTAALRLEERHGPFGWRAFTDSAPILEKRAASEAGLGWIGRNTLLISPRYGSFMLLGELLIDRAMDSYDTPSAGCGALGETGCGGCRRCVDACPNGALTPEGLDARKCIACITIERDTASDHRHASHAITDSATGSETIPDGETAAGSEMAAGNEMASGNDKIKPHGATTHGWIFGCDECQSVCPYNAAAPMYSNPRFSPTFDPREISAEDWRAMTADEFRFRFADTPLQRAGLDKLKMHL